MRISDWSSDVCSSDLVCAEAPVGPVALLPLPAVILGTGGDGRNGLLAGLIDAAGELAVDGVRPARGGDLVTGAGIARCFTGPVSEVVAVTQRNRHRSEEHTSELQSLMRIPSAGFRLKKKN